VLRQAAMEATGCDCLELSTPPTSIHYHIEGDFCHGNSGRILCRTLERCGIWNCRLGDFMCPRHEYNFVVVPYGGKGDCSASPAPTNVRCSWLLTGVAIMITMVFITN